MTPQPPPPPPFLHINTHQPPSHPTQKDRCTRRSGRTRPPTCHPPTYPLSNTQIHPPPFSTLQQHSDLHRCTSRSGRTRRRRRRPPGPGTARPRSTSPSSPTCVHHTCVCWGGTRSSMSPFRRLCAGACVYADLPFLPHTPRHLSHTRPHPYLHTHTLAHRVLIHKIIHRRSARRAWRPRRRRWRRPRYILIHTHGHTHTPYAHSHSYTHTHARAYSDTHSYTYTHTGRGRDVRVICLIGR